jgi:hypothetical protein
MGETFTMSHPFLYRRSIDVNNDKHSKDENDIEKDQLNTSIEPTAIEHIEEIPNVQFGLPPDLQFLSRHISDTAKSALLESEEFRNKFLENVTQSKLCKMFVFSIDIRRSTELMLKARSPEKFASFITKLCNRIINIIFDNYGIVDKFTGDGILAFFPDFYSGEDAGYYVLDVAVRCHQAFNEIYKDFRSSFISVLKDIGLGIGIDYGEVHYRTLSDF